MTRAAATRSRRRPRLSDAETRKRMLAAGAAQVAAEGLSLSPEHVNMEDLIRAAGVSRTSSYRQWPHKDAYAHDLLLHLASSMTLSTDSAPYAASLRGLPATLLDELDTRQGRHALVVEALRRVTLADLDQALASQRWRNYVVLRAAHQALPDAAVRAELGRRLASAEAAFLGRRTAILQAMATLLGYRLRDPDTADWRAVALQSSLIFTGVTVLSLSNPAQVRATAERAPFGSAPAPWSDAAIALVGNILAASEPDPKLRWDAARCAQLRALAEHPDAALEALLSD